MEEPRYKIGDVVLYDGGGGYFIQFQIEYARYENGLWMYFYLSPDPSDSNKTRRLMVFERDINLKGKILNT